MILEPNRIQSDPEPDQMEPTTVEIVSRVRADSPGIEHIGTEIEVLVTLAP